MSRIIEPDGTLPDVPLREEDKSELIELVEELASTVATLSATVQALAAKPSAPALQPVVEAISASQKQIAKQLDALASRLAVSEWDFKMVRDPYGFLDRVKAKRVR